MERRSRWWHVLASPRAWLLVVLGFSSGLPLLLVGGTLSAWMTNLQVDLRTIGVFTLVAAPYSLKFAWAPLLDRYQLPFLGRRRGWMLAFQLALAAALFGLSGTRPAEAAWATAAFALLVSTLSASLDVVVDAWRTDVLTDEERGFGTATFVLGYRMGMLTAGAVALTLSDFISWEWVYRAMAAAMLLGAAATLLAPEPQDVRPPRSLRDAVVLPFADYFRRRGALGVLLFLVLYRIADAVAGGMTTPFVLGLGFSNAEVGTVSKGVGMVSTLAGSFVGGVVLSRVSMKTSLWVFGVLQALTNLGFIGLHWAGRDMVWLAAAIASDSFCGGLAATAFVAFVMSLCNREFSATQYALLSALATLGGRMLAGASGYLAEALGWPGFFLLTVALGAPALVLLRWVPMEQVSGSAAGPGTR